MKGIGGLTISQTEYEDFSVEGNVNVVNVITVNERTTTICTTHTCSHYTEGQSMMCLLLLVEEPGMG